jgi:hypothetical protein
MIPRIWGYVAAAAAAIGVVLAAFLRGQRAGRDRVRAEAAEKGQAAQAAGDAAAAQAQQQGAKRRLMDGQF